MRKDGFYDTFYLTLNSQNTEKGVLEQKYGVKNNFFYVWITLSHDGKKLF